MHEFNDISKLVEGGRIKPDKELLGLVEEYAKRQKTNKINSIFPDEGPLRRELYPKHMEFIKAGLTFKERCMLAANRSGKSFTAAYETACHLTLDYPHWWMGRKFNKSVNWWACGLTIETTRDIAQHLLLGPMNAIGTGMIPKDRIIKWFPNPDLVNSIAEVWIKDNLGGTSRLTFKSYNQGFESYQGIEIDGAWLDEEPPMSVYAEVLIRTMTTDGMILCTFTPLKGLSEVVLAYLPDGRLFEGSTGKFVIQIGWDEAPHLTEKQKKEILDSTPPYQREARSKGVPQLGVGAIYPIAEEEISCDPFPIPSHWLKVYGLDVGWKKTAAIWGAYNPETDTWYLYDEYYRGEVEPAVHAAAIRGRGKWIQGVVDPAAGSSNQRDGQALINIYQVLELKINPANNAVEAGIQEVFGRMTSGRLKVFKSCYNWFSEYRIYRRKSVESRSKTDEHGGAVKVVKAYDHLMDATRYLIMSGLEVASTEMRATYDVREEYNNVVGGEGRNPVTGY